jgi:dolichol-phosphate mannosyltransferase
MTGGVAVVIPVHNETENLPELYRRIVAAFEQVADPPLEYSLVYVNDGSTDDSLATMLEQQRCDYRVTIVDLSRNFGHQAAITAGLDRAAGDAVILMDADLQDPPELIPELIRAWRAGANVVHATRRSRRERGLRRLGFALFYPLFAWVSDTPLPAQVGIFGLLDRRAIDALRRMPEKNRFLPGLRTWIGFEQHNVPYDRAERAHGHPRQRLGRLIRYAFDGIFSFSYKPLRLMVGAGVFISGWGFVLASVFIGKRLLGIETAQTGFTTLVTVVLFLGGVQLIALGVLGEYIGRIYDEVKQRPLYVVRDYYERGAQAPPVSSIDRRRA